MTDQEKIDTLKRHNHMRLGNMALYLAILAVYLKGATFTRENMALFVLIALCFTFSLDNFLRVRRRIQDMQQNNVSER